MLTLLLLDMVFSEDAILLSFFSRYEGEEGDLKDAIVKYCSGGTLEANRPGTIDPSKGEITDLDQVNYRLPPLLCLDII